MSVFLSEAVFGQIISSDDFAQDAAELFEAARAAAALINCLEGPFGVALPCGAARQAVEKAADA